VPYQLTLEPDHDRGGYVYRAVLTGELDPAAVRELSEWLGNAKLNPDASFVVDLSHSTGSSRARFEMQALLRRHADLQLSRRLSILAPRRSTVAAA
jgi:hypothetical protein